MSNCLDKICEFTWLIPVMPLVAFVLILITGKKGPGKGAYIGIAGITASFVLAVLIAARTVGNAFSGHEFEPVLRSTLWAVIGSQKIFMGYAVDQLTAMMLIVVTLVAMLVQIYSTGYMHGDERYPRFFAYLSFFSAAMLSLVIADNLLLFFISWELVGLASYLLIGFWFPRQSAMRAAKKAFIVTRVGDVGFFLGLLLVFSQTGQLNFHEIFKVLPTLATATFWGIPVLPLMGLLLFMGAVGKSAQFPLHVWLPDAMEGPTPVSALIHAATMVAAGVYLVGRMYPVFAYNTFTHEGHSITLQVVAIIGAITAIFAATIALVQNDIKRVLAYSTISQLGYMMLGLGLGPAGYTAGLFHLMTHAFFKANMFLGSGSVIHGTGTQNMQEMGGLAKKMPKTYWTFFAGYIALAGVPFTAGFFSKDEILLEAYKNNMVLFFVALAAAFLTAFYMTRLMALTFWGQPRSHEIHAHESPFNMTGPLVLLGILSLVGGFVGAPWHNVFHHFIRFGETESEFSLPVAAMATMAGFAGIALGLVIFVKGWISRSFLRVKLPWAYNLLLNKYYMDEFYWAVLVVPLLWFTRVMAKFDQWVIDGIVNGVGFITLWISKINSWFDKWVVDGLVNLIGIVTRGCGRVLRYAQTGVVQNYLLFVFLGVVLIVAGYLLNQYFLNPAHIFNPAVYLP